MMKMMHKDLEIRSAGCGEDKDCASYNWSIRNNNEGIRSEPLVAPLSPSAIVLQTITLMSTAHISHKALG
jgi:hypothetical protein